MLAWLVLLLFVLVGAILLLVLVVNPPAEPRRGEYVPFILALDALFAVAYALNAAGHHRWAAAVTVMTALLGPWGSVVIDPTVMRGDFVPLAYTIVPVLLCSILLSPRITASLAAAELAALSVIALRIPVETPINWPSFIVLFATASMLSIVASIVSRDDIKQIDRQRRQLERSEAELRELSVRDHLTGLFNRRYLEETLQREIRRSARTHRMIGLILLDVDQFKEVNDEWGHAAGDLLLLELGELLVMHIRGGDIACRLGGDEFVIVLPEASLSATRKRAEELRSAVQELHPEHDGRSLGHLTISVGVATYPHNGDTIQTLIRAADRALYRAKAAGRDRIMTAEGSEAPAE